MRRLDRLRPSGKISEVGPPTSPASPPQTSAPALPPAWIRSPAVGRELPLGPEPDVGVVLDLVAAASAAGAGVTGALAAVGQAVGGLRGAALVRAGAALDLGSDWDLAWAHLDPQLAVVGTALRPTWERGARAGPALRAAADAVRRERHSRALEAAGRLGTRLVLPLGLCYLPAFVLVGLAPVIISMAAGTAGG